MKKSIKLLVLVLILTMIPINAFAAIPSDDDSFDPNSNKHRHVKELCSRIEDVTFYPIGQNEYTALRKAYCTYQEHYKVYQVTIGNEDVRHFLYDEYKTRWTGYWRL